MKGHMVELRLWKHLHNVSMMNHVPAHLKLGPSKPAKCVVFVFVSCVYEKEKNLVGLTV